MGIGTASIMPTLKAVMDIYPESLVLPLTMAAAAAAVEVTTSAGQEASAGVGTGVMELLFCRNRANPTLGEVVVGTVVP